jgi:3-oxoacyl-[acyl-carrier protein] reductase
MKTAIVLGGSRGIGKAIADSLKSIDCDVTATSKNELDTSSLESVSSFAGKHNQVDILVLNTGGPEPKEFFSVTDYTEELKSLLREFFELRLSFIHADKSIDG